jgi:pilus assembly protein TadC
VTAGTVLGGCLVAAALILAVPRGGRRRGDPLDRLRPAERRPPRDLRRLSAAFAGVAAAVLIGDRWGLAAGAVTALVLDRVLHRLEPAAVRAERRQMVADLPLAADLLAAALRAGAPVDRAVAAVADALAGPLGIRLHRVARVLRMGGAPAEAWAYLEVPGADRIVAAAVRSAASGGALAGALGRLADDLRAGRTVAAEAAVRRAGVLIVLPLGLCFLPAFVLAGLVPVVVAVLGDVL